MERSFTARVRYHFILYLLLPWYASIANGQPVYFRHYQVEDGLANNTVFSVFQDSRGFMWFGTKEGLNRFDGVTFRAFDMKQQGQQDIKEFVYCIVEGIHRTLWTGTRKGLYEFDPRTENFSLLDGTKGREILDIKSDGKGKIWFTSDLQLYCYDEGSGQLRHYGMDSLKIAAICLTETQTLWACSLDGYLFRYDAGKDTFHCMNSVLPPHEQRPNEINRIFSTASGQLLIGSIRGLTAYDPERHTYRPLLGLPVQKKPVYVRDILAFSKDEYWIASESGLYSINTKTGHTVNMRQQDANPYAISDNAAYTLYKDREGGIWCGTYFGGLNYYHSRHSYFKKYFRSSGSSGLSGNAVRELCADGEGHLWIGTEDAGLNRLDMHTGEVTRFTSPETVSSTNIHALLIDGHELWVGTFQQGLDVLDRHTGKRLRHYNAAPAVNGLKSNFIISACRTQHGDMLFGTSHGIYRYHRPTDRFTLVKGFPESIYVFSLYEDGMGVIWAGTIGHGLYFHNPRTGVSGNFSYDARNNQSLSSNSVSGISEDSEQQLWVSTEGGGVCRLDKTRRHFTRFNTGSGLPGDMVYKVLEDKNKQLWISTSKGLARYNPARDNWKIYTQAHGLLTDQFNYSSGYRDASGTLYFGSVRGLISFNPDFAATDKINPAVYFTNFQVHNQDLPAGSSALRQDISFTDTIRLKYDQSSFAISFAALTYVASDMTPYAYQLDGADKSWTYLPGNRKVYYTNLPPGDYTFRVRTVNSEGDWLNEERRLLILISPPWWLSRTAYGVYLLLVLSLIYLGVTAYHRRQKEKHRRKLALFEQEKEKEIYKAKIEFFTNVAHEIRTPLTLIKGPLEMVIDDAGDQPKLRKRLKSIERNTERLVALTDQLLDFRKTENQDFSLSFVQVNVPRLVQANYEAFMHAAQQKKLSFTLQLPEKSFHAFIDTEAFQKILSNLIGNAVKYAAEKVVIHVASPSEDVFRIAISNDGPLIPWAFREKIFEPFFRADTTHQPGSGIGLSLARVLTRLHNGTLELQQAGDGMNLFVLSLPVHQQIEFKLNAVQKKST
ncbi:histidine kinase [Chitinophaga oryzae]|uniref:histidine kinase n=1 Tax=Chitinophaga oryzae TaxID=2725414 RepID=A0AAE6ZFR7_9BACT|nr:sensor histidine kinase [Chitinophaga oryzae]QJB32153.1 histidine kinase [Chitinophaga oryzae]